MLCPSAVLTPPPLVCALCFVRQASSPTFRVYQQQVLDNCQAFATALQGLGCVRWASLMCDVCDMYCFALAGTSWLLVERTTTCC